MRYEKELRELFFMQQIYANLFSITNKIQMYGDKCFDDITIRQFMAILAIMHIPEDEATINQVAVRMGTTKQNANVMINSLVKKGLVKVEKSAKDKRAVNVTVTEAGVETMTNNGIRGNLFMADLFAELDEQELEILWRLLKKLGRFDGKDSDGYEDAAGDFDNQSPTKEQQELLAGFAEKRRDARMKGSSADENNRNTPEGSF